MTQSVQKMLSTSRNDFVKTILHHQKYHFIHQTSNKCLKIFERQLFCQKRKKSSSFFWKENLKQGVKLSSSFFSLWQILTRQARKKKICMEVWGVRRRHLTMAPPFETHTVVWFNTLTKPCLDKLRSVFASISNLLWSSFVIVVPQKTSTNHGEYRLTHTKKQQN